jgi:hypothetical protein
VLIAFNKPYGVLSQFTDRSVPPRPTLATFACRPVCMPPGGSMRIPKACCCSPTTARWRIA